MSRQYAMAEARRLRSVGYQRARARLGVRYRVDWETGDVSEERVWVVVLG